MLTPNVLFFELYGGPKQAIFGRFEISKEGRFRDALHTFSMFIKKDRRKINEIFREEGSAIESLKLSKRKAEFQGTLRIICHESKAKLLGNLKVINLYDNDLNSVDGIGILSQTPVEDINLGCNKLAKLPLEVRTLFGFRLVCI